MTPRIESILRETIRVHNELFGMASQMEAVARAMVEALSKGKRIYVMGNGGSAADSQHLAAELVGRFRMERHPLPCHAFSTDTSVLTAIANDYGVEEVFVKQVQAFVGEGDVVIGISTSGNAPNVVAAVEEANRRGAVTVGLTGRGGGRLGEVCRMCIRVPSDETPRIQEAHQTIIHILCELVEQSLFGN